MRTEGRGLTRREFDAVIRRAAELSSSDSESSEGALSEAELFRIAGEVGLTERHVRTALAEVGSGVEDGGVLERYYGPAYVRASRVVPGTPETLAQKIDTFLDGTQLLQRVRRTESFMQYRPAADWASQMARAGFGSKVYHIASARSVEVQLEAVDAERTFVGFLIEPGTRRSAVTGPRSSRPRRPGGSGSSGTWVGWRRISWATKNAGGRAAGAGAGPAADSKTPRVGPREPPPTCVSHI